MLTGSNWHEVMHSAQWSVDPDDGAQSIFVAALFSFVFVFLVLCVMNLVISLVIESYTQDSGEDGDDEAEEEGGDLEEPMLADESLHRANSRRKSQEKQPKRKRRLTSLMVAAEANTNMKVLHQNLWDGRGGWVGGWVGWLVCRSVGLSVCRSVGRSVCLSVCLSVCPLSLERWAVGPG